jgi:serine/threonine-protein kinase
MRQKKLWSAKWKPAGDETWQRSGGQGKLRLLRPIDDPNAPPSVLKELNNQTDPDRRRRMRREVATLETLPHPATPRLLDHNTEHFADPSIDLYSVFEFIPGPTLGEYVADRGSLNLEESIALVRALLDILGIYHDAGSGHRDIKPDNIILRNSDPLSPVLIDFGLTFNIDEPPGDDTPDWQQVGNRFLALPEHAAFSANKRDLRSDLTFCVAILFFALTGAHPATLSDEEGRLPHQRTGPRARLDTIPAGQRLTVLTVFDIGFSFNLAYRWQTIDAVRTHIDRITAQVTDEDSTDASVADIRARAGAKSGNLAIKRAIDQTRARLKAATVTAVAKVGQGYEPNIEERLTTMHDMSTWIRCGVLHIYDGLLTNTFYGVNAVGDELVISELIERVGSESVVVGRIPLAAPATFPELETIVQRRIIENVHRTIEES